jgi:hypothetical protein
MEATKSPEVVREKVSRVGAGRLSCALIFDREFEPDEIRRFYSLSRDASPMPGDFDVQGRVLRYECAEADEAKWRLAAEILLVKSFREDAKLPSVPDARARRGLRPLHR